MAMETERTRAESAGGEAPGPASQGAKAAGRRLSFAVTASRTGTGVKHVDSTLAGEHWRGEGRRGDRGPQ